MAGFTGIISKKERQITQQSFSEKNIFGHENNYIKKFISGSNYIIEQYTNNKFLNDKTFRENSDVVIGIEGVILNLDTLKKETKLNELFDIINYLYKQKGKDFVKDLRGEFAGFIYLKASQNWIIFTNPTGSKRIFWLQNEEFIIFGSELRDITHLCHELNINISLNSIGAYLLLTYAYMLESVTLINEINRLMPGRLLQIETDQITEESYFNLASIQKTTDAKEEIIEKMDDLFTKAIHSEFKKDLEYGYKHIATLSGGLDSRMTVLVAHKSGYRDQLNFTFSQSNYLDEKISKQIASDYGHEFIFQSLDNGNYLKNIDKTVYYNDGLILYSGSSHVMNSIEKINTSQFGLIHTGQIGDAVIGSFLSKPERIKPSITSGAYSTKLLHKIEPFLQKTIQKYSSEELYKFYGRAFLAALNGNYYFDIFTQTASPFLDLDFLSYCYSIPDELKHKQKIYLEWIAKKHPEFGKYRWEKTGVSPLKSRNFKRFFDLHFYQRMHLKLMDRIYKKINTGMNPFDEWLSKNKDLQEYFSTFYTQHISLLDKYSELKNDCEWFYKNGNTNEKLQVLTLLSAIKLHFNGKAAN